MHLLWSVSEAQSQANIRPGGALALDADPQSDLVDLQNPFFAKLREDLFVEQLKQSATSWTSVSVSPLILKS